MTRREAIKNIAVGVIAAPAVRDLRPSDAARVAQRKAEVLVEGWEIEDINFAKLLKDQIVHCFLIQRRMPTREEVGRALQGEFA